MPKPPATVSAQVPPTTGRTSKGRSQENPLLRHAASAGLTVLRRTSGLEAAISGQFPASLKCACRRRKTLADAMSWSSGFSLTNPPTVVVYDLGVLVHTAGFDVPVCFGRNKAGSRLLVGMKITTRNLP